MYIYRADNDNPFAFSKFKIIPSHSSDTMLMLSWHNGLCIILPSSTIWQQKLPITVSGKSQYCPTQTWVLWLPQKEIPLILKANHCATPNLFTSLLACWIFSLTNIARIFRCMFQRSIQPSIHPNYNPELPPVFWPLFYSWEICFVSPPTFPSLID
jgi:hypothetical protein